MNFNERCYLLLKRVPRGRVVSYGEIARALGIEKGGRAVGNAMVSSPGVKKGVNCHRVVRSNGEIGGYCGKMDNSEKVRLLEKEGVEVRNGKIDLNKYLYVFK
jgi:O-6-methylguanine DNA methyltransferase